MMNEVTGMRDYFVWDDGGRLAAGFKGSTGDCGTRALAIATGKPYQDVYDMVIDYGKNWERNSKRRASKSHPRTGIYSSTFKKIATDLGGVWTPTMFVGSGCKVHLTPEELPKGRLICNVSKHYCAVIDGFLHDTCECSRDGTRCVYGYYTF
jgi:hypothetical protein